MQALILIIILTASNFTFAATTLTWEQCVQRTREHNEQLQAELAQFESAAHRETIARSGFLPQVTASTSFGRTETEAPTPGQSEFYGADVRLEQSLFTGLSDWNRTRQAKANTKIAEQNLRSAKARISRDLKITYSNLQYSLRLVELQKSIVERRAENVRLVELRFQGGRENKGSVLLSQAILEEAKLEETQARLVLRAARADLARVIALENPRELSVSGDVPLSTPPSVDLNLEEIALQTPAALNAMAAEEAAQAGVGIARANFFPSLSVNASVNRGDEEFFPDRDRRWSVGVGLSIPLFRGGRNYAETKIQSQNLLASIVLRSRTLKDSLTSLETTLANYLVAVDRVKVAEAFVEAVSLRAEIGRMRYNNGLISFEDWYNIENELIGRQRGFLQAKRDRVHTEAAWEEVQGKGVIP